jgi:hypothetical protein
MSWKKVAYLDEVATLSSNTPQAITAGASGNAGAGAAASKDDHVHASPATWPPTAHASAHQNSGGDEISVAGLSGELADAQPPKTHATSHKSGGGDALKLNELAAPTGAIAINKQSLTNPVIDPQATAPGTPVDGQAYYSTADDHVYIYVA